MTDTIGASAHASLLHGIREKVRHTNLREVQRGDPGIEAREVEQVRHEDAEALGLAQRAAQGADATALLMAPEYMGANGSTATAREWSVLDVLYAARNAACGFAISNWQTVRTDSNVAFYYGYVGPKALLSPAFTADDDTWDAWCDWVLDVVLPTTGASITRA